MANTSTVNQTTSEFSATITSASPGTALLVQHQEAQTTRARVRNDNKPHEIQENVSLVNGMSLVLNCENDDDYDVNNINGPRLNNFCTNKTAEKNSFKVMYPSAGSSDENNNNIFLQQMIAATNQNLLSNRNFFNELQIDVTQPLSIDTSFANNNLNTPVGVENIIGYTNQFYPSNHNSISNGQYFVDELGFSVSKSTNNPINNGNNLIMIAPQTSLDLNNNNIAVPNNNNLNNGQLNGNEQAGEEPEQENAASDQNVQLQPQNSIVSLFGFF